MSSRFYIILASIVLLFAFQPAAAKEQVSNQSFVIFNTKCANCHEGQCSSRMCFQMPASGATTHIRNYAGEVSDKLVEELYKALRYMKHECAYCSSPATVPANGKWTKDDIVLLSLSSRQGVFIPLGKLSTAKYTIELALEEPGEFRIEIMSEDFEPLIDERFFKPGKQMSVPFSVEKTARYYLRIRSRKPLLINKIELAESKK